MKKLVASLGIFLLVTVFYFFNTFYTLEYNLSDRLISDTSSKKADNRIKIIAIDDKSLSQIGRWPWPRDILANLIDKLAANGAKAVWADVIYSEKAQDPRGDEAWSNLVKKYPNVYLSADFHLKPRQDTSDRLQFQNIEWPIFPVQQEQIGHINVLPDRDLVVRHVILGIPDPQNQMVPAVSVRLANQLLPENRRIIWRGNGWYMGEQKIAADPRGEIGFTYTSAPQDGKFDVIPIDQVLNGKVNPAYFKDSIVLIGPYAVGLQDMYYTPKNKTLQMFGVEIHANLIQSLKDNQLYSDASKLIGIFLLALLTLGMFYVMDRLRARWSIVVLIAGIIVYITAIYEVFAIRHILLPFFYPGLAMVLAYVASVLFHYLAERNERKRVTTIFGRYVSKSVVSELLSSKEAIQLGGIRKDVSLMFVDIRGFTPLSEKMQPEEVIQILNEYLDLATRAVFAHEGTLDKFIGDGVMSIFGAPVELENHADKAVRAALMMKSRSNELAARLQGKYGRSVSFGIGINSGPAVIGNIGSQERLDYTAIGDTVNLAARLESNAKPGQILISEGTYERVKGKFKIAPLEPIKVKGKENPVMVYSVEEEL